jgi:putative xylitol transport system permease protein
MGMECEYWSSAGDKTMMRTGLASSEGNSAAAAETGINPRRVKTIALTISGGCAGIAGVLISARLNAANGNFGQFDLLDAKAAVVIGGTALAGGVGSLIGTLFGVLIIVTIRNGLDLLGVSL